MEGKLMHISNNDKQSTQDFIQQMWEHDSFLASDKMMYIPRYMHKITPSVDYD